VAASTAGAIPLGFQNTVYVTVTDTSTIRKLRR
jgi:hypothetical protein